MRTPGETGGLKEGYLNTNEIEEFVRRNPESDIAKAYYHGHKLGYELGKKSIAFMAEVDRQNGLSSSP
jgi:hypothetical protein